MKKVLAITVALMIAAIISMPALGYTMQIVGNQSFTATSGEKVGFSISPGVAGHNLTQGMVTSESKTPAVQSNRVAYSIKQGAVMPYTVSLVGVNAMGEGQTRAPAVLGSVANRTQAVTPAVEPVTVEAVDANVTAAPEVAVPKFTIEGMLFNDTDGNSTMDNNETALSDWTVNLEQPAGMVIMSANTSVDGRFIFPDLNAGEYTVTEVLKMGWRLVSPSDGKFSVNVTDTSVTGLVFANQLMPVEAGNETVEVETAMPVEAENVTMPSNDTALVDATVPA